MMTATTPKVSVCIPAHQHAPFISEAISSVLGQTMQDYEVVVVDDASTDGTAEIVSDMRVDEVRLFRQARNVGVAANRNTCLRKARGEFVAWLDADDIWLPHLLERQVGTLEGDPRIGLVHGAFHVIDGVGTRLPAWPAPFDHDVVEPGETAFRELLGRNEVSAPTVVVRRALHEAVGPYAERIGRSSTDWEMWMRMALRSDFAYTAEKVACYRRHAATISARTESSGERLRCDAAVIRRVFRLDDRLIRDRAAMRRLAGAALAAKALLHAGDLQTRDLRRPSVAAVARAIREFPPLGSMPAMPRLVAATALGNDYQVYRNSKHALARLSHELSSIRYGRQLAELAAHDPDWEKVLCEIASVVRKHIPAGATIAVIDKWDPTLLRLSRRTGLHFPDRRLSPDGYPPTSEAAIEHLETVRSRGADYLVIPCSAFWWLEHYAQWRDHLESNHRRIWDDRRCVIYALLRSAGERSRVAR